MTSLPNVFTIPIDAPFLKTLAAAVLKGFPCENGGPPGLDQLSRWTILLPTRRACGELERCLLSMSGARAMLLPRIRALGDVDEDLLGLSPANLTLPDPISPIGRDFAFISLIEDWSKANPQTLLAQKAVTSRALAHGLAVSLGQLIDELETEDVDLARIPALYEIEFAAHREAILDLLTLVRTNYPEILRRTGQIGQRERRSLLLRREARMLSESHPSGPTIAAGSTGSIPATRALLRSVAALPNGAVVLPGVDLHMDEESWEAAGPQHPQFMFKQLLGGLNIRRHDVRPIQGAVYGGRSWLAGELMRPTETTENWFRTISARRHSIHGAMEGIELVELPTMQEESVAIALMFRQMAERPHLTVSLVTPDRMLARRVKSELRRWNMSVADSAGELLACFPNASLLGLLADAVTGGFSPVSLRSLLHHDLCRFGLDPEDARRAAGVLDIAGFSEAGPSKNLRNLDQFVDQARAGSSADPHSHPLSKRISEDDWAAARIFAGRAGECLGRIFLDSVSPLAEQLSTIMSVAEDIAGSALWEGDQGQALARFRDQLLLEAKRAGPCSMADAAAILLHHLKSVRLFRPGGERSRFSILGLLEARLLTPDVVILGGLNEGTWPAQPDTGPWLNRPMRDALNMEQPEGGIGRMAHDFVQCLGVRRVFLVWSRRDAGDSQLPSRWVLRLQMLLRSAGMPERTGGESSWHHLASMLDSPGAVAPQDRPRPRPPANARPRKLSVTRVETLIRDPYAFYARAILKLHPLEPAPSSLNLAKRGTLIHAAIGDFLRQYPETLPENILDEILRCGRLRFMPLLDEPEIAGFWWPDFERMASWIATDEPARRAGVAKTMAEVEGALEFSLDSGMYTLVCRADRIDLMQNKSARIVDYKTGSVPPDSAVKSGFAPQLTLQAVILSRGGFRGLPEGPVEALQYIKLKGGQTPGEAKSINVGEPILDCALRHFDGLKKLLSAYAEYEQPYLPRVAVQQEDIELEYDHLSRYREWVLSSSVP